jgi:glycosyltransferase involved in cell wall biosynthesis
LVFGTDLRDRFTKAGIGREDRYEVIRSVVDVQPFRGGATSDRAAMRAALDLPVTAPIVLFAGSLDQRKGAFELPRYFARVKDIAPDAHLVVAGEGPARSFLVERFARLGLGADVTLLGFTPRLPEVIAAADCLIALSSAEGLATVLLLAAAAGTPFVSYEVDGPRELITLGATGDVVALGDWRAAARATCVSFGRGRPVPIELPSWSRSVVYAQYRAVFDRLRGSQQ